VKRRVVVTGLGTATPIGVGSRGLYEGLRRERSAIDRTTRFTPEPFSFTIKGEVREFEPSAYLDPKRCKRLDRYSTVRHIACAQMACEDVRLDLLKDGDPTQVATGLKAALDKVRRGSGMGPVRPSTSRRTRGRRRRARECPHDEQEPVLLLAASAFLSSVALVLAPGTTREWTFDQDRAGGLPARACGGRGGQ
jgi:3-oxoacyl-(acyl-carrier-protein) synthase